MRALFAPHILAKTTQKAWDYHQVDHAMVNRAGAVLEAALDGGRHVKRAELSALLRDEGIPDDHQQHYFLYGHLSQTGLLCQGPRIEGKDTFSLMSRWSDRRRRLSPDEAVVVLAERFFSSHGPATLADFANWSGLPRNQARAGLAGAASRLHHEDIGGTAYWQDPDAREGEGTYLLPAYDELCIGYQDRRHLFAARGEIPISTYNGIFFPLCRRQRAGGRHLEEQSPQDRDPCRGAGRSLRREGAGHGRRRAVRGLPPAARDDRVRPSARPTRPTVNQRSGERLRGPRLGRGQ